MRETSTKPTKRPGFAAVVAAFAGDPRVAHKRMFSSDNVLNVKGKIFAMLVKGKLVAKLPKERVDDLVGRGIGERFAPVHGRLMKEWVGVGAGRAPWVALAKEAYHF
jgi:hypothetical protein